MALICFTITEFSSLANSFIRTDLSVADCAVVGVVRSSYSAFVFCTVCTRVLSYNSQFHVGKYQQLLQIALVEENYSSLLVFNFSLLSNICIIKLKFENDLFEYNSIMICRNGKFVSLKKVVEKY